MLDSERLGSGAVWLGVFLAKYFQYIFQCDGFSVANKQIFHVIGDAIDP